MKKEEVKKQFCESTLENGHHLAKYNVMLLSVLVSRGTGFLVSQDPFLPLVPWGDCRENGGSVTLFISSKWVGKHDFHQLS